MTESSGTGGAAVRAAAARIVASVVSGRSALSETRLREESGRLEPADRGLFKALCFGTLRWQPRLAHYLGALLDKPVKAHAGDVESLLLVGLFQLAFTRVAPHAAVSETVEAARVLNRGWAAGLVNAVLRRYQRDHAKLERICNEQAECRLAHPGWLLQRLVADWPDDWEVIARANNEQPPMWLRVNARRASAAEYAAGLASVNGVRARTEAAAPQAVRLVQPVDVTELPGFADGVVSIQDAAAQLAPLFLEPESGMRILDACAAPGGKTCHMLELCEDLAELVAVDSDEQRMGRLHGNLQRLGLMARTITADVAQTGEWWDGTPFDRILLDVPCSATGVIRRHPDIKLTRRVADLGPLVARQAALLDAVWSMLAPGGRLLYATCSVLQEENAAVTEEFLARSPDAQPLESPLQLITAGIGRPAGPGLQILPGEADMDGFYYACLHKADR